MVGLHPDVSAHLIQSQECGLVETRRYLFSAITIALWNIHSLEERSSTFPTWVTWHGVGTGIVLGNSRCACACAQLHLCKSGHYSPPRVTGLKWVAIQIEWINQLIPLCMFGGLEYLLKELSICSYFPLFFSKSSYLLIQYLSDLLKNLSSAFCQ